MLPGAHHVFSLVVAMGLGIPPAEPPPPTTPASAAPNAAPVEAPRTRIVIGISAADPTIELIDLKQALAGHLADTGLSSTVATLASPNPDQPRAKRDDASRERLAWASRRAQEPDVLAVFWIERVGHERRLYLFEPQEGTTWVRELPLTSDPDLLVESLGTMVRGISLWLETGPPTGMAPVPPPEPEPPNSATDKRSPPTLEPTPPPAAPTWGVELVYAGGNFARIAPWQNGGGLALDLEWPIQVMGRLTAAMVSPAIQRDLPRTTIWRTPVSLSAGYRFRPSTRAVRPWIDASVVVEPMWWQVSPTDGVETRPGRTLRVAVAPGVGLRWRLRGGLGWVTHAQVDIRVREATLVVSQGGERIPRLTPHPIAAFVRTGLFYSF